MNWKVGHGRGLDVLYQGLRLKFPCSTTGLELRQVPYSPPIVTRLSTNNKISITHALAKPEARWRWALGVGFLFLCFLLLGSLESREVFLLPQGKKAERKRCNVGEIH